MPAATMTSKGQTVIPKPVRDFLGLHPGDEVDFIVQDHQTVLLKPASMDVRKLKGLLRRPDRKPVTLEAIDKVIRNQGGRKA
ncbi:MAG TPA: AbrB/MazE/SpoVT family DNA-binding domain-containing protein [Kiritimatiellia bacterium]|nr:AbrB/MazE/SpoVT family DNA-binding domain-containing protein [Kiritimatiellia bacterium]HMO98565.1 AbrB/MazE/SpoVT family DNA-binding domain-containing protein [Kiritimatiellia bacterium]HMP97603.1 AbrB/MazE/SpoVT family DNA-binding domain-containing protein [Kiritimatiellia bacterium]